MSDLNPPFYMGKDGGPLWLVNAPSLPAPPFVVKRFTPAGDLDVRFLASSDLLNVSAICEDPAGNVFVAAPFKIAVLQSGSPTFSARAVRSQRR